VVSHHLLWVTEVENGAMENVQAIAIFLSLMMFLLSSVRRQFSERLFFLTLALLCFSLFLRELDMEDLGLNPVVVWLTSGVGRNLLLSLLWVFSLLLMFLNRGKVWKVCMDWIKSFGGQTMILAGFFFVSAWPFDKEMLPILSRSSRFFEELLELNGYLLIWMSSFSGLANGYPYGRLMDLDKLATQARTAFKSSRFWRTVAGSIRQWSHAVLRQEDRKRPTR
jgi:hypothetical protein